MNARIGFSRHRGFAPLSWAIMAVEGTPYSHAYVKFYSTSMDRWLVYEATGKGVFFKALARFDTEAETIEEFELPIPEDKRTALMQWAVDASGTPYGRLQVLGILLCKIGKKIGRNWRNPFQNGDSHYICDELVEQALRHLGYVNDQDQDTMGLVELRARVEALGLPRI